MSLNSSLIRMKKMEITCPHDDDEEIVPKIEVQEILD